MQPDWYGRKYPTFEDLEAHASELGALVGVGDVPKALYIPKGCICDGSPAMIQIPQALGLLERTWLLAHEVGHLVQHEGARGEHLKGKDEHQADRWAAQALIPEEAVRRSRNASVDSFIGALSKHYQDLPPENCPDRALAGRIAKIRLSLVEAEQDSNKEAV
jgi:hypothetical protein